MLDQPVTAKTDENTGNLPVPWGFGLALGAMLLAFGVWITGQVIASGIAAVVFGVKHVEQHLLLLGIISYQALAAGVFLAATILILSRYHRGPDVLGYRRPDWTRLGSTVLIGVVAALLGTALLYYLFNTVFPSYQLHGNARDLFPIKVSTIPRWAEVLLFLWVAIEAPLTEETLFRGVMFQGFLHYFEEHVPRQVAILAAALLSGAFFGLAHMEIHTLPLLIFLGVVLAYVYYYGRSIYASVLVHGLINATSILALFSGK